MNPLFLLHRSHFTKGRQWAESGQPGPFLLGPWAQWARHNGLLIN